MSEKMSPSIQSKSTTGGIDFDQFCKSDTPNYTDNLVNLVDDKEETGVEEKEGESKMDKDTKKLSAKVNDVIKNYEIAPVERRRKVTKYYIGKTYLKRRKVKNKKRSYCSFDHMKSSTWIKKGISSRYRVHLPKPYGSNGLIVLAAITKDALPKKRAKQISKEDYALILEQRLIHHQLIEEADDRVTNLTFNEGKRLVKKEALSEAVSRDSPVHDAYAYAIYMTIGCDDKSEEVTNATPIPDQREDSSVKGKKGTTKKKRLDPGPSQSRIPDYFRKTRSQQKVKFADENILLKV